MGLTTLKSPVYIHMDLTRHCNFKCFYCSIRDNASNAISEFPLSHFTSILDRIADAEVFDVSFFGGEPFLYPDIYELANYGRNIGLTVGFLSNGSLIKPADIKRVTKEFDAGAIALNGLGSVHDKMVGVNGAFEQAIALIRSLTKEGFELAIDNVVSKSNFWQFDEFLTWIARNLEGVEVININTFFAYNDISPEEVLGLDRFQQVLSIIDKHVRSDLKGKLTLGGPVPWCLVPREYAYLANSCSSGWMFAGIDCNGDVRMCPWSSKVLGNIFETKLSDIWQDSEELKYYRSFEWTDPLCTNCAVKPYCSGGCHVVSTDPPYSLAKQWKQYVKPISIEEARIRGSQPNPTLSGRKFGKSEPNVMLKCNPQVKLRKEEAGFSGYCRFKGAYWLSDTAKEIFDLTEDSNEKIITQTLMRKYGRVDANELAKDVHETLTLLKGMHFVYEDSQ